MSELIREAGWGIYPVLLFGCVSLLVSLRYAAAPRRDQLPLVIGFAAVTILAGFLGAVRGVQTGIAHLDPTTTVDIYQQLANLRESLHNMVVAFVFAVLDGLLATAGAYRLARVSTSPSPAAQPST